MEVIKNVDTEEGAKQIFSTSFSMIEMNMAWRGASQRKWAEGHVTGSATTNGMVREHPLVSGGFHPLLPYPGK